VDEIRQTPQRYPVFRTFQPTVRTFALPEADDVRREVFMRSAIVLVVLVALVTPVYGQSTGTGHKPRSRSFGYARLGYGAVFADGAHGAPAFGFGYRGQLESVALDVSFLNFTVGSDRPPATGDNVFAGSLLRLEVLRLLDPEADRSAYIGGGMSWGGVSAGRTQVAGDRYTTSWSGSGLQGEVTAGYELARNAPMRIFVQADIGLPLFMGTSSEYTLNNRALDFNTRTYEKQYMPSATVTFGIGWRRR
jgi:hypothetical protein